MFGRISESFEDFQVNAAAHVDLEDDCESSVHLLLQLPLDDFFSPACEANTPAHLPEYHFPCFAFCLVFSFFQLPVNFQPASWTTLADFKRLQVTFLS